ncbi:hypothetical protein [Aureimonas sp. ME7]|uniref:hypothetical protein n=1 Tax=Aureimonas sp. ME7 TaxID=2744252 RepID=UPI0015F5E1C2|nr:hypothetical protein [Aureimonas sp. ME7]
MIRPVFAAALFASVSSLPALAQTFDQKPEPAAAGTSESVAKVRDALIGYVTAIPFDRGVLRVEPDPAGQRITIDPAAVLTEFVGTPVRFAPFSYVVSERADGTWNVFSDDRLDISASPELNGVRQSFVYTLDRQMFKGVFSPEIAAFLSAEAGAEGMVNEQSDPFSRSVTNVRTTKMTLTGAPSAEGGADLGFRQTYEGYKQTTTITVPTDEGHGPDGEATPGEEAAPNGETTPGEAAVPFSFGFEASADAVEAEGSIRNGRTVAVADLYALVLRHADDLEKDAKATLAGPFGTELKTALQAVLPVWSELGGSASARKMAITSLYGGLEIGEARQALRFSGVQNDASFDIDFGLNAIAVQSPFVPSWAVSLLPREMALGLAVSGVDLKTPADLALAEVDFAKDPPLSEETQARVSAAFDPSKIRTKLKPSRIRADDFDIAFSGDFAFADEQPSAEIAVDVGGLDTAIATLQKAAAEQPELYQAVGTLQFVKGIGRPRADGRLEWLVAAAADGSVSVNGTVLKGPDTLDEPDGGDGQDLLPGDEFPGDEAPFDEAPGDAPADEGSDL